MPQASQAGLIPISVERDRVTPLHYVVLPQEVGPYTLTASGVLLDAVALEKPLIARKMPIFEAMFENHGDIGYLFRDNAELKEIIWQIVHKQAASRVTAVKY